MQIVNPTDEIIRVSQKDGFSIRVAPKEVRQIPDHRFSDCAAAGLVAFETPVEQTLAGQAMNAIEPAFDYKALTVKELRALCKERGKSGYSKLKEDELIALLESD